MQTMLSIKIDKKLKDQARKTAQDLGVSLNAVIIQYIKEFVAVRTITFTEYSAPNERTRRIIEEARKTMITALKANQKNHSRQSIKSATKR